MLMFRIPPSPAGYNLLLIQPSMRRAQHLTLVHIVRCKGHKSNVIVSFALGIEDTILAKGNKINYGQ